MPSSDLKKNCTKMLAPKTKIGVGVSEKYNPFFAPKGNVKLNVVTHNYENKIALNGLIIRKIIL